MLRNSINNLTKNFKNMYNIKYTQQCCKLYSNSDILSNNNEENASATTIKSDSESDSWNWIPPRKNIMNTTTTTHDHNDIVIPCIPNQLLTTAEIENALKLQGGENIVSMDIKGNLDTIKQFVIVSGRSSLHMRKMADTIVSALKARNLRMAPGYTGVEGDKDDDWMVVDCHDIVVNFMLPNTRKALNIESHWSSEKKPLIDVSPLNTKAYDERFDELLELYPIPTDYGTDNTNANVGANADVDTGEHVGETRQDVTKEYQNNVIMEPFAMKSLLKYTRNRPHNNSSGINSGNRSQVREKKIRNAHNGDYVHQEGERTKAKAIKGRSSGSGSVGRKKTSMTRK